jgi:hypothetical protein
MANVAILFINKNEFIVSKWEIPPYLMLFFSPEDKIEEKMDELPKVYYRSTAGRVKNRLNSIGLSLEKLQSAVKHLHIVSDDVIDYVPTYFSEMRNNGKPLELPDNEVPEDIGFLFSEFDDNPRYAPIGHMWLVRLICDFLPDETEVSLDPNQVIETWDFEEGESIDLHSILLDKFSEEIETYNQVFQMLVMPLGSIDFTSILHSLSEDELIRDVVVPLLEELGFRSVTSITHHGMGELGNDIKPFYLDNAFGLREYYSVQTKAVKIHSKSGKKGHVNEVIDQMKTALTMPFIDPSDNSEKRIDHFIIISSHDFTPDARRQIEQVSKGKRDIMIIDDQYLIQLIKNNEQTLRRLILKFSNRQVS